MSNFNFTVKTLDNLPLPEKGRKLHQDNEVKGLYVRVTPTGTKSFVTYKWIERKKVWTTHGQYPSMTIKQARSRARTVLNVISEGINPNKLNSDSLAKHEITLQKVFDDYCLSKHNIKTSTMKNYVSIFDNYLNDWKKKPLGEISRDMIEQRHRDIGYGISKFKGKESPTRANTTMRLVRALFNYAIGQYEDSKGEPLFVHNPVVRLTSRKVWFKEKIRQDTVRNYDLKKWYDGVMKLPLQDDNVYIDTSAEVVRDFLIFVMFSGLRRNEVLEMKWSDIDFRNHSFTLEDTKNNESHSLPLNFKLDEVLERRKNDSDNPYIFQGKKPNGYLHPPKRQLARARKLVGFHFTNHDLRRTFGLNLIKQGMSIYKVSKLLGHRSVKTTEQHYAPLLTLEIEDFKL